MRTIVDEMKQYSVSVTGDESPLLSSDGRVILFKDIAEAEKFVAKELVADTNFDEASKALGERYCPRVVPWGLARELSWAILGRSVRVFESADEAIADMDKLQEKTP